MLSVRFSFQTPAFVDPDRNVSVQLGNFHDEWKRAKPLESFDDNYDTVIDQLGDVDSKLQFYENCVEEFNHMVAKLCDEQTDNDEETACTSPKET